jgi:ADP-ribose pyrophosphatase YjhB (NUDIX family)
MGMQLPQWLGWARTIQALAQTGLTYSKNEFDTERYQRLMEIAAEMVESQTDLSKDQIRYSFSMQPGYATPKVDVRGAVVQEGKILLVQERSDGRWSMPGGWADVGDVPSRAVAREVREESGFQVRVDKVIGLLDANRFLFAPMEFYHAYKMIFLCSITGGKARPSNETLAVGFFDPSALPPLSSMRTDRQILKEVFAHVEDPARPTAFD